MQAVVGSVWLLLGCACMAGCAYLIWEDNYFGVILLWPGAVLSQFGIATIWCPHIGVKLLGKDATGFIPVYRAVIFFPFLLVAWIWWLIRYVILVCKKEPAYDKVWDNVYVGRYPLFSGFPENTELVVDLTTEMYGMKSKNPACRYVVAPALDTCAPSADVWLNAIKEIIDTRLLSPSSDIYVHCAYGHGRSGITVAAAMVRIGTCASFETALQHLRETRPSINWQPSQENAAFDLIGLPTELPEVFMPNEAG
eukprot:TRINITY_DN10495_c0_g1_i1.p1 TRINITY_DN10495_c0_g1~~TRINITY_DN10495_c0_g1_i1.p1  ORF type:complete len:253 (+),score=26.62 TRINITY_DN10495_c0_g1_i1:38-796(+)